MCCPYILDAGTDSLLGDSSTLAAHNIPFPYHSSRQEMIYQ